MKLSSPHTPLPLPFPSPRLGSSARCVRSRSPRTAAQRPRPAGLRAGGGVSRRSAPLRSFPLRSAPCPAVPPALAMPRAFLVKRRSPQPAVRSWDGLPDEERADTYIPGTAPTGFIPQHHSPPGGRGFPPDPSPCPAPHGLRRGRFGEGALPCRGSPEGAGDGPGRAVLNGGGTLPASLGDAAPMPGTVSRSGDPLGMGWWSV